MENSDNSPTHNEIKKGFAMSTHWKNFLTKNDGDRQWLVQVNVHGDCVVYRIEKDGTLGSFASSSAEQFCHDVMAATHESYIVRQVSAVPWCVVGSKNRWRDVVSFLNKKSASLARGAAEELLRMVHGLDGYVRWRSGVYEIGEKGEQWDRERDAQLKKAEAE